MDNTHEMIRLLEDQQLEQAAEVFQKIKKTGKDEEWLLLADQLSQVGFLEEAKELYDLLLKHHPQESELRLLLAELSIDLGKDEEALEYLEGISPDDPDYASVLLLEADLYQMLGLFEVSEQKLIKAKELYPGEPVILYALAELHMSIGRFLEAAKSYEKLLKEGETSIGGSDVNGRLAEALSAGGAFDEAIVYYECSLKAKEDLNVLFGYGLTAFQAGLYPKAKDAFVRLREQDYEYHSLYLFLSKTHEKLGDKESALQAARDGLAVDEYHSELNIQAASLLLESGDEEEAETLLRQAIAIDPEASEAVQLLSSLLITRQRYKDAVEIIESAGESQDSQIYWNAAYSYQQLERYEEALNAYKHAYNDFNTNTEFLSDYGYFLMEEGRQEEATPVFRKLSELEPLNEEWPDILARLEEPLL